MCGDLGIDTYCPGTKETIPEVTTEPEPQVTYDFDPPESPVLSKVDTGAAGKVSMTVVAERGSRIVVSEGDRVVTKATGTGKAQRISFTDRDGTHTYEATATDAAGNESMVSDDFTVVTDARAPSVTGVAAPAPTAATGAVPFSFTSETGATYALTLPGVAPVRGTVGDGAVRQLLWLRNGSYPAVLTVKDAVGNATTVRRTINVKIAAPTLKATLASAVNQAAVQYALTGTPRSKGTLTFADLPPVPFTVDDDGHAQVTFTAADGTYPAGKATLTDFAGRRATLPVAGFTVDATKPTLVLRADAERAKQGVMAVLFTAEAGTKVILTATATDPDAAQTQPITSTVIATGAQQSWTPTVAAGHYRIAAKATDEAGNAADLASEATVADPVTGAELIIGLLVLLFFAGLTGGTAWWAWTNRHRFQAWQQRRRDAAAAMAHQSAVAAAQASHSTALAAHRDAVAAYQRADAAWAARAQHLDHLVNVARHEHGQHVPGFAQIKLKAGERVYLSTPAALVEERSRSGVPVLVETCTGTVVATNMRVIFDGSKNRQWVLDQLQRADPGPAEMTGSVVMTVTSRKNRSGVRPLGKPSHVEEANTLLLAAIGDATGQRARLVARLDGQRDAHRRARPTAPLAPIAPAILQPAGPRPPAHLAPVSRDRQVR